VIKVIINGIEKEYNENDYSVFEELWEEIKPKEEVVVEIRINGISIPIDKIEELFKAEIEGNETVEVKTKSIYDAALDLIDEALSYVTRIEERLPELSNKIILGQVDEAMNDLKHVIDGISALENMRESISKIVDIGISKSEEGVKKFQQSLEVLTNINQSLLSQNFTDLVEDIDVGLPKVFNFYKQFLNDAKAEIIKKR